MAFDKTFSLEEFPLVSETGVRAGLIDVEVSVEIRGPDDWLITNIALAGYRDATPEERSAGSSRSIPKPYYVDHGTTLFCIIADRFDTSYSESIAEAYYKEHGSPRSDYSEHSTYIVDGNGVAW